MCIKKFLVFDQQLLLTLEIIFKSNLLLLESYLQGSQIRKLTDMEEDKEALHFSKTLDHCFTTLKGVKNREH